jgi:hypothetical protein
MCVGWRCRHFDVPLTDTIDGRSAINNFVGSQLAATRVRVVPASHHRRAGWIGVKVLSAVDGMMLCSCRSADQMRCDV